MNQKLYLFLSLIKRNGKGGFDVSVLKCDNKKWLTRNCDHSWWLFEGPEGRDSCPRSPSGHRNGGSLVVTGGQNLVPLPGSHHDLKVAWPRNLSTTEYSLSLLPHIILLLYFYPTSSIKCSILKIDEYVVLRIPKMMNESGISSQAYSICIFTLF